MTETSNYKLQKPAENEKISPKSIAKNADITDAALTAKADVNLENVQSDAMAEQIVNAFNVHLNPSNIGADQIGAAAAVLKKLTEHEADAVRHIKAAERTAWTSKASKDLSNVTNDTFRLRVVQALTDGIFDLKGHLKVGTYDGTGTRFQTIYLDFAPVFVFVVSQTGRGLAFDYEGEISAAFAGINTPYIYSNSNSGYSATLLELTKTGFTVQETQDTAIGHLNDLRLTYRYFALG